MQKLCRLSKKKYHQLKKGAQWDKVRLPNDDLHAILSPFESLATSVSVKSGILASSLSWTILLKHSLGLLWKKSLPLRMRKDFLVLQSHSSCRFMLSLTTKAYLERDRHLQDTRVAKSTPILFNNSRATQLSTLFWLTRGKRDAAAAA